MDPEIGRRLPDEELFHAPQEALGGEVYLRHALAYDGHGLQFAGMGREFLEHHPEAMRYFQLAEEVLGYDLLDVCLNGSREQLNKTAIAQPAIVTYNLVANHAFAQAMPEQAGIEPTLLTYQSLGMLNAIHRAGVFGDPASDDAIRQVIKLAGMRGQFMQEVSDNLQGGMWLLSGAKKGEKPSRKTKKVFPKVLGFYERNGIVPAIERNEVQTVVSGLDSQFERIHSQIGERVKKRFKISAIKLPGACGPFHSEHMRPAADMLSEYLDAIPMQDPKIPILSNSYPVRYLTTATEIKDEMINGITRRVYGRHMMDSLYDDDLPMFEIGEKMLMGDTLSFDERFDEPRKIPVKGIATASGVAAIAGGLAVAYLIKRRSGEASGNEEI